MTKLNDADALRYGASEAARAYLGSALVWEAPAPPSYPTAVVQQSIKLRSSDTGADPAFSNPLPANITPGNDLIFVWVNYGNGGSFPLDTGVTIGGQTAVKDHRFDAEAGKRNISFWRVDGHPGGNRGSITIASVDDFNFFVTGYLMEVHPLATDPFIAGIVGEVSENTAGGTAPSISTTGPTTQDHCLVIAVLNAANGETNAGYTTIDTGFTVGFAEQDSFNNQGGQGGHKFATAAGVQTATFHQTLAASAAPADMCIVAYKLAPLP